MKAKVSGPLASTGRGVAHSALSRLLVTGLLLLSFLAAFPAEAQAADFRSGPEVRIGPDEVVDEDVYAAGGTVMVEGMINGDLVVSGGTVDVRGTVNGSVTAAGGNVTISGPVEGGVRVAGGRVIVRSSVGRDVIAAGGNVILEQGATVVGDLVTAGGSAEVHGTVQGDARLGGGAVDIAGTIEGNVHARTGEPLTLRSTARIGGNLTYISRHEARVEEGAVVMGTTERRLPTTRILGIRVEETPGILVAQAVLDQVRWFLGIVLVGLLLLWLIPRALRGAGNTLTTAPWRSAGLGLGVLVLLPILVVIVTIAAVLIGGIAAAPVGVVPLAAYLALLGLAAPLVALVIGLAILGRTGRGEPRTWVALVLGAALLAVIGFVPYLSAVVAVLVLLFGFGAWLLFIWRQYAQARAASV